jgi:hypothetical protein
MLRAGHSWQRNNTDERFPAASAMSRTAQVDKAQPLLLDLPGWTAEQTVIDKAKSKMN